MKRILLSIIVLLFTFSLYSQTSCYNETRSRGISFYNKRQYENAIKAFTAAKSCPDKPKINDLDSWISKCKSKPTSVPTPAKTDTYIKVDGKSSTTSTKSSSGGTEPFNISTDARSWTTWGVPSWCSIENKTSGSFVLRVKANTSTSERTDYMEVRTPNGHSARINIKQSGKKPTGPSAQVESITVDHNQSLDDGKGMIIHVKFDVQNMKGKNGRVVAYFYDNDDNALIDTNGKYNTSGTPSNIATGKDITPNYDNSTYSDLKLSIPYSELHQTGTSTRSLKFKISIWDKSVNPNNEFYNGSSWTTFSFTPGTEASLTVDGNTSDKTKYFSESGGRETYYVKTSASSYETWGVPSWCSIENKTSSSFTLVCDRNTSTSSRSDYMKVKAAGKEIRIDITQSGKKGPSAVINNLWVEHNVFNGMSKGMRIHINLTVNGMLGKTVKYCVFFYLSDNTTRLINMYGGHISSSATSRADYESCTWSDWWIFVPYQWLYAAANRSNYCSFDVEIQDLNRNLLVRNANTQFVLY